ncbi:MAG: hypothetical protein ACD_22C00238G0006 [uncultured bacterium]|nr:MAG: hypothetical protein ACD_22C00238G0006 [uncultured bacterium]
MAEIVSFNSLVIQIPLLKSQKKKIVLVHGCFDVIHVGHARLFKFAKKHGDILVVGAINDALVTHYKGATRPIFEIKDRLEMLAAFRDADYVFEFKVKVGTEEEIEQGHNELYKKISPDVVASAKCDKESEYKRKRCKKMGIKYFGGALVIENKSSVIIRKIGLE